MSKFKTRKTTGILRTLPSRSYECTFCGTKFDSETSKDVHMSNCLSIISADVDEPQKSNRISSTPMAKYSTKVNLVKDSKAKLLYVKKDDTFRGYKTELLKEELPSYLKSFVICSSCEGLMRKACGVGDPQKLVCLVCADKNNSNAFTASDDAVENLVTRCPLRSRGCIWTGTISSTETHMDTCDYFNTECELSCGDILQRIDMQSHLTKECPDRKTICTYCLETTKFKDTLSHEGVCEHFLLQCVSGCGGKLKRMDIQLHYEDLCPNSLIECTYNKYGCDAKVIRKDFEAHKRENRLLHLEMKTDFIEQKMDSEIQKLKNENASLREELHELKAPVNKN